MNEKLQHILKLCESEKEKSLVSLAFEIGVGCGKNHLMSNDNMEKNLLKCSDTIQNNHTDISIPSNGKDINIASLIVNMIREDDMIGALEKNSFTKAYNIYENHTINKGGIRLDKIYIKNKRLFTFIYLYLDMMSLGSMLKLSHVLNISRNALFNVYMNKALYIEISSVKTALKSILEDCDILYLMDINRGVNNMNTCNKIYAPIHHDIIEKNEINIEFAPDDEFISSENMHNETVKKIIDAENRGELDNLLSESFVSHFKFNVRSCKVDKKSIKLKRLYIFIISEFGYYTEAEKRLALGSGSIGKYIGMKLRYRNTDKFKCALYMSLNNYGLTDVEIEYLVSR